LVYICGSYVQKSSVLVFLTHSVVYSEVGISRKWHPSTCF